MALWFRFQYLANIRKSRFTLQHIGSLGSMTKHYPHRPDIQLYVNLYE